MTTPTDDYSTYSFGPGMDELVAEFTDTPEKAEAYERDLRIMVMTRRLLMAIDQERERRGLTKADLAKMIGVNPASVRRLFSSGDANPTLRTVLMLMAALRIDMEVKVQGTSSAISLPQEEQTAGSDVPRRRHVRRKKAAA